MQPQLKSDWFKFSSLKMIGGIQILQMHIKVRSQYFSQTADTFAACTTLPLLIFFTNEDMTPIQDIAGLALSFTLGLTVGLMLCYLIFREKGYLVLHQRPNQPVEQSAVPAPRRRNGRKQPTEHDERLAWAEKVVRRYNSEFLSCMWTCYNMTRSIFVRRMERCFPMSRIDSLILNTVLSFVTSLWRKLKFPISSCPRCS